MVDQKITELTELTTPANDDVVAIVDDTLGTPVTKKITYANLESNLSITASQVSDFDTEVSANTDVSSNTSKQTNVSTNLSLGAIDGTTMVVVSSDGTDVTLISADTDDAGLLTAAKFDEIVANTSASHTQNTDTALGSGAVASDHGTAATDEIINVSYGTGDPPAANTTTEGSLFVKYTV